MKKHLDEREITTAVAGLELEVVAAEHLARCLSCRQRVSAMHEVIDARRRDLEAETPDWERQRQEILLRLPPELAVRPTQRRVRMRPLFAVAAVVVVAIGLRIIWAPAPPAEPVAGTELPVEQILAEVDAMLADDSIPGFELIEPGLEDAIYENGAS
jgi:hypothetical protein